MTEQTADLENEVRRLRVRIIGLTTRQLDELVNTASGSMSRRDVIVASLTEFSHLSSGGQPVPELGDSHLADQIVVLLEHGMRTVLDQEQESRDQQLSELHEAAVRLRRSLA